MNTSSLLPTIPKENLSQTGITGLDEILCGGLPRNRFYLIQGSPGLGKTTLALQFLLHGVKEGEKGIYITLSESKEELSAVAKSHGWDLDSLRIIDLSMLEKHLNLESQNTMFHPAEIELSQTTKLILDEITRIKPSRVVFDSLAEMQLLAQNGLRYRRQILALKQFFTSHKCTVLLLNDYSAEDIQIQSIVHGVITLEKTTFNYGVMRRRIRVDKLRGIAFKEGNHDFIIVKGGLVVFPRLVASEHLKAHKKETLSSGIKELDQLLGGGLDYGTSTLFMGSAGTGKSSLAIAFANQAALRKEHVAIFGFDESNGIFLNRAKALNMDLEPHIHAGVITTTQIDPAELSPGELTSRIKESVQRKKTKMVVIDSLNGYLNSMPEERYLILQLHELLTYLNQQGVITILILAQHGFITAMSSPVDITYLSDSVVVLRFFEVSGAVKKAISIIKKRSGNKEDTIREFQVTANGIVVGKPLDAFQGILTGTPTYTGKPEDILK